MLNYGLKYIFDDVHAKKIPLEFPEHQFASRLFSTIQDPLKMSMLSQFLQDPNTFTAP